MNLVTVLLMLALGGEPPLVFSPSEWNLGGIEADGGTVAAEVVVQNRSGGEVEVSFVSTCACLGVAPARLLLTNGETAPIRLTFDPTEESGPVEKDIIVRTNLEQLPIALYLVHGEVRGSTPEADAGAETKVLSREADSPRAHDSEIVIEFYASPGCRSCRRLLRRILPRAEWRTGVSVEVREHNILDAEVYAAYLARLRTAEQEESSYPALIVGDTILQGEENIERELEDVLLTGSVSGTGGAAGTDRTARLALIPVLAAGLLDGVNPCAFTTLVFLISALAVAGRSRIQVLQIGLFFSAAVFATYLLIGLGFFQAVRMASAFPVVATAIRWTLIAALLGFAALSLHDYVQLRRGATGKVLLQLPQPIKRRLHRDIKQRARSAALIASSLLLGFLVALFELACTGQVYFPTLVYLYQVRQDLGSLSYLLAYNAAFILPLIIVFALSYWGIQSQKLARWVQGSMKPVKLLLTGLFLGLAVLTALT